MRTKMLRLTVETPPLNVIVLECQLRARSGPYDFNLKKYYFNGTTVGMTSPSVRGLLSSSK